MANMQAGALFYYTGPPGSTTWRSGSVGGWQPRAWTSHAEDPHSRVVTAGELRIDFADTFCAEEVRHSTRFTQARVALPGGQVCMNVAKAGVPWVWIVRQPGSEQLRVALREGMSACWLTVATCHSAQS